jgi:hypothetical protein
VCVGELCVHASSAQEPPTHLLTSGGRRVERLAAAAAIALQRLAPAAPGQRCLLTLLLLCAGARGWRLADGGARGWAGGVYHAPTTPGCWAGDEMRRGPLPTAAAAAAAAADQGWNVGDGRGKGGGFKHQNNHNINNNTQGRRWGVSAVQRGGVPQNNRRWGSLCTPPRVQFALSFKPSPPNPASSVTDHTRTQRARAQQ